LSEKPDPRVLNDVEYVNPAVEIRSDSLVLTLGSAYALAGRPLVWCQRAHSADLPLRSIGQLVILASGRCLAGALQKLGKSQHLLLVLLLQAICRPK
jgi:hypothetical protein